MESATQNLLQHYKIRCEEYEEKGFAEIDSKFEELGVQHDKYHQVCEDLEEKEGAIFNLQKQVGELREQLAEYQAQVLNLQGQNQQLAFERDSSINRLRHLENVNRPTLQEVKFFRDCRPEAITKNPSCHQHHAASDSMPRSYAKKSQAHSSLKGKAGVGTVLRMVYLPNDKADIMGGQLNSLQKELQDHKLLHQRQIKELELEHKGNLEQWGKTLEEWKNRNQLLQNDLQQKTTRYLSAAKACAVLEARGRVAARKAEEAARQARRLVAESEAAAAAAVEAEKEKSRELLGATLQRNKKLESEERGRARLIRTLQEEIVDMDKSSLDQVATLKKEIFKLKKKCKEADRRRALDFQGYRADVAAVQRGLRALREAAAAAAAAARGEEGWGGGGGGGEREGGGGSPGGGGGGARRCRPPPRRGGSCSASDTKNGSSSRKPGTTAAKIATATRLSERRQTATFSVHCKTPQENGGFCNDTSDNKENLDYDINSVKEQIAAMRRELQMEY